MPQVTQGRKRYLLPTPDRSKPSRPPTQDLSALKLDQGYKGTGVLRTTREDGKKEDLYITSTTAFYIGRRPDCDYVVSYPVVSRRHMKIFAIRNEVEEALVCVEDVSTSNGILYNGSKPRSKSIFLNDGDTIEIPKTGKKFTYIRDPTASSSSNKKKISMTEMTTLPWNELEKRFGRKKTFLKVGNYRIDLERKLGSGTFGEVRLAWDEMREVQVACKTVRKEKMRDARDRERLLNELELGVALQHPNLNSVLCWKEIDGDFHIFLKLVTGGDLFSYVSKHQGLEQSETKYLLYQLLKGVKYMHESGCAHRDLKLENILLQGGGSYPTVLVCDFGLSTPLPASPEGPYPSPPSGKHTKAFATSSVAAKKITAIRAGSVVGTVTYFPPEYLAALREETRARQTGRAPPKAKKKRGLLDATKSDSWALGIIRYIMATGCHPFGNEDDAAQAQEDEFIDYEYDGYDEEEGDVKLKKKEKDRVSVSAFDRRVQSGDVYFNPSIWNSFHPSAIDLIRKLLEPHADERLTVSEALDHRWFDMERQDLEDLYRVRVLEGNVDAFNSPRSRGATR